MIFSVHLNEAQVPFLKMCPFCKIALLDLSNIFASNFFYFIQQLKYKKSKFTIRRVSSFFIYLYQSDSFVPDNLLDDVPIDKLMCSNLILNQFNKREIHTLTVVYALLSH